MLGSERETDAPTANRCAGMCSLRGMLRLSHKTGSVALDPPSGFRKTFSRSTCD